MDLTKKGKFSSATLFQNFRIQLLENRIYMKEMSLETHNQ